MQGDMVNSYIKPYPGCIDTSDIQPAAMLKMWQAYCLKRLIILTIWTRCITYMVNSPYMDFRISIA